MCNREQNFGNRLSKKTENIIGGLFLVGIGGLLLARQVGADLPDWLFTWPMILVVVGLFVGVKTHFKDFGWLILMGVGIFFLVDKMKLDVSIRQFLLPVAILGAGLLVLIVGFFGKSRSPEKLDYSGDERTMDKVPGATKEDVMEVICVFGSTSRVVLSKNFRGGEVISIFGSSEINLTNADFNGKLKLEVVQVFGGTKLIIPPHWEVQSKTAAIFGGIEDKRSIEGIGNPEKVLVLEGATVFGGVTISSY